MIIKETKTPTLHKTHDTLSCNRQTHRQQVLCTHAQYELLYEQLEGEGSIGQAPHESAIPTPYHLWRRDCHRRVLLDGLRARVGRGGEGGRRFLRGNLPRPTFVLSYRRAEGVHIHGAPRLRSEQTDVVHEGR